MIKQTQKLQILVIREKVGNDPWKKLSISSFESYLWVPSIYQKRSDCKWDETLKTVESHLLCYLSIMNDHVNAFPII